MAIKLMSGVTAVGASRAIRVQPHIKDHTVYTAFRSLGATKIAAVVLKLQGSATGEDKDDGVVSDPVIAIGSTAEKVANGAFDYLIANVPYSKGVVAAGSVFTVAHTIAASKWGIIYLYINAAGTIVTKVPGVDQTANQSYDTAAEAHAAGDTITHTMDLINIGHILILNDASLWTANTDDLTDASDVVTTTFISKTSSFQDLATNTFSADELTAQKSEFHVEGKGNKFLRHYLSTLTGTGEVDSFHTPIEN